MQFERVRTRSGLNDEDIRRILQAQASRTTRLAIADDVIDNRGDRDALHEAVERLHQRYLTLATLDGGLSKPA
jgi:dephospho-CoA kinase